MNCESLGHHSGNTENYEDNLVKFACSECELTSIGKLMLVEKFAAWVECKE